MTSQVLFLFDFCQINL
jgi:hypothetical protein